MKYFLSLLVFIIAINVTAQNKIIVKYYDSLWQPAAKTNASFYINYEDKDSIYDCISYYSPSNKIYSKFIAIDTFPTSFINFKLGYYEDGKLKDSSFNAVVKNPVNDEFQTKSIFQYKFYESGKVNEATMYEKNSADFNTWIYYENGKLWAHIYRNKQNNKLVNEVFDSTGNLLPNYIYRKQAEFPGGFSGWAQYLTKNLDSYLPMRNGTPSGKYIVFVKFTVEEDGSVSNVSAENNPGYGMMEEAIRILKECPKWEPAIQYNKPIIEKRRQSITFKVE